MLVARTIWGEKVKGQGHSGHSKILPCPLCGSMAIWPICFIHGTNIVHDMTMCRDPILGQRSRSNRSFQMKVTWVVQSFCHVLSVALSLLDRFTSYVVHTQPMRSWCVAHHFRVKRSEVKVTRVVRSFCRVRSVAPSLLDRFTSYVVHRQPMRSRCVAHHFRVKRSRSPGSFEVFAVSAQWLRPYWTDSLHMWYTHNPWSHDVSRTISGSKGQRSRSPGSFEVFAVSAPWLCPYWTDSLRMWYTHNPWGQDVSRTISGSKVKGQAHKGHLKFLAGPLHGSCYTHIPCTYTTKEGTMWRAPFLGQKVDVQCHTGSYVNCVPLAAEGCRSY